MRKCVDILLQERGHGGRGVGKSWILRTGSEERRAPRDPGNYRGSEELEVWSGRDPIPKLREQLVAEHGVQERELDDIDSRSQEQIEKAVEFAMESPEPPPAACLGPIYAERRRPGRPETRAPRHAP